MNLEANNDHLHLDNANIFSSGDREACEDLREVFKLKCPPMWVNHFDRKYDYINFKKKLYSEGAESVDQKFEEKR